MSVSYVLRPNRMAQASKVYRAVVKARGTVSLDDVIQRMVSRGSTVTRADILGVFESFEAVAKDLLLEGWNVQAPLVNLGCAMRGTFEGPEDQFDAKRHRLVPVSKPNARLRRMLALRGRTVKGEPKEASPNLVEFTDLNTGNCNSTVTPGGMACIMGRRLRFDGADEAQGVFFIGPGSQDVRVRVMGKNKPSELVFLIPKLTAGTYTLEVRARGANQGKPSRGTLPRPLTVPPSPEH